MRTVAVLQSNYIPWKGYFDIIHDVDIFIFYDDVQYTKNDWRNRNRIMTPQGPLWLTIPVGQSLDRQVCQVSIDDPRWALKHFKTLRQYYGKAPFFNRYSDFIENIYGNGHWNNLSDLNQFIITKIANDFLGIATTFQDSRTYNLKGSKGDRLLDLLIQCEADRYISGPSARDYIDKSQFEQAGVELVYKDYSGYPEYSQFGFPFEHGISILDLLFHKGPEAPYFIWGWR